MITAIGYPCGIQLRPLPTRTVGLILEGVTKAPTSVTVNGAKLDASAITVEAHSVAVQLPAASVNAQQKIVISLL